MRKLRPCPFCGCASVHVTEHDRTAAADWAAQCDDCFAVGPAEEFEDEARDAWNERADDE